MAVSRRMGLWYLREEQLSDPEELSEVEEMEEEPSHEKLPMPLPRT